MKGEDMTLQFEEKYQQEVKKQKKLEHLSLTDE